jgi:hypothetical protein
MAAMETASEILGPRPVLGFPMRRPLSVQLHSKDTAVKAVLVVNQANAPRAIVLVEKSPELTRSAKLSVTVNGTTAIVNVLKHMTAKAIAEELARDLSGQDPALICDVQPAISEDEMDAVLLEIRLDA